MLNQEMNKVYRWMNTNHLRLNSSKTKFMIFKPNLSTFKDLQQMHLQIGNNETVEQVQEFKYLGLIIDNKLNWSSHIKLLATKLSRTLGLLYKVRHFLDKKSLLLILNSMFLSHLQYGIICWGRCNQTAMKTISTLLNKVLRCINFSNFHDSSTPLYIKYNLLKVEDIFKLEVIKFMYKWSKGNLPPTFNNYFNTIDNMHKHNTRYSKNNYFMSRKVTKVGMGALDYIGVRLWREVPADLKKISFCNTFARHMKRYFVKKYVESL